MTSGNGTPVVFSVAAGPTAADGTAGAAGAERLALAAPFEDARPLDVSAPFVAVGSGTDATSAAVSADRTFSTDGSVVTRWSVSAVRAEG